MNRRRILWGTSCLLSWAVSIFAILSVLYQVEFPAFVPARIAIVPDETIADGPVAVRWNVPPSLLALPSHRNAVRIWEDGKCLPFRLDQHLPVTSLGGGRFCLEEGWLWFSATDNKSPRSNGRTYEVEILRPSYHRTFYWLLIALLAAAFGLGFARLWRSVPSAAGTSGDHSGGGWTVRRWAGGALLLVGLLLAAQALPSFAVSWRGPIPAGACISTSAGSFDFHLPRFVWLDQSWVESIVLYEDGVPLSRDYAVLTESGGSPGTFFATQDRVAFRPRDASNPCTYGHAYAMSGNVLSPGLSPWLGALAAVLGCVFIRGAGLSQATSWDKTKLSAVAWHAAICALAILKLAIVSGDDIFAEPGDTTDYASSAQQMLWAGTINLPAHAAGFPFAAGLAAQVGIPWRLALEALYLCACYALARALLALRLSRFAALGVFAFMTWHAWTLAGFGAFMCEPFVLVMLTALAAAMGGILAEPPALWRLRPFLAVGLLLFFWNWSRSEDPLVYASCFCFIAAAIVTNRLVLGKWSLPPRSLRLLAVPLILLFVMSQGVNSLDYLRYGVYAKSKMGSPGALALMKALYRIKPEREIRYAPVTRQSLTLACIASPTLARYRDKLLDLGIGAVIHGEQVTRVPGEFGPWLIWVVINRLPMDSRESDALRLKAAGEIDVALREGRLPERKVWFPLDPNYRLWLPDLLPRFKERLRQAVSTACTEEHAENSNSRLCPVELFNHAASRRAANIHGRLLRIQVRLMGCTAAVDGVAVMDKTGLLLGACPLSPGSNDDAHRFDLSLPMDQQPAELQLGLYVEGRLFDCFPLRSSVDASPRPVSGGDPEIPGMLFVSPPKIIEHAVQGRQRTDGGMCTVTVSFSESAKQVRRDSWRGWLTRHYATLLTVALLAVAGITFFGAPWGADRLCTAVGFVGLMAAWIVGRAAFYALLDVNVGWFDARYMLCVSPLFMLILFLVASLSGALLKRILNLLTRSKCP